MKNVRLAGAKRRRGQRGVEPNVHRADERPRSVRRRRSSRSSGAAHLGGRGRAGQEKRAFNDGRKELLQTRQALEFHDVVHSLSRSGGKVNVKGIATAKRATARKKVAKRRSPRG